VTKDAQITYKETVVTMSKACSKKDEINPYTSHSKKLSGG